MTGLGQDCPTHCRVAVSMRLARCRPRFDCSSVGIRLALLLQTGQWAGHLVRSRSPWSYNPDRFPDVLESGRLPRDYLGMALVCWAGWEGGDARRMTRGRMRALCDHLAGTEGQSKHEGEVGPLRTNSQGGDRCGLLGPLNHLDRPWKVIPLVSSIPGQGS